MTGDIMELIYLVMLQAVEDANAELRDLMEEIRRRNKRLCRLRKAAAELRIHREADPASDMELVRSVDDVVADQLKSLSDMSEALQIRLQMAMDRQSKARQALSNLLKKQSDTASAIVKNMK